MLSKQSFFLSDQPVIENLEKYKQLWGLGHDAICLLKVYIIAGKMTLHRSFIPKIKNEIEKHRYLVTFALIKLKIMNWAYLIAKTAHKKLVSTFF